jgi:hypothetical protein
MLYDQAGNPVYGYCTTAFLDSAVKRARAEALREAADRAWPLLKKEYEWRHEDSECGGDEISEGLDMLNARLISAITQEADK